MLSHKTVVWHVYHTEWKISFRALMPATQGRFLETTIATEVISLFVCYFLQKTLVLHFKVRFSITRNLLWYVTGNSDKTFPISLITQHHFLTGLFLPPQTQMAVSVPFSGSASRFYILFHCYIYALHQYHTFSLSIPYKTSTGICIWITLSLYMNVGKTAISNYRSCLSMNMVC